MNITSEQKKFGAIAAAVVALIAIFLGFGKEMARIDQCYATAEKWVTAEYSETSMQMDFDGNMYLDTDYWSEYASPIYHVATINGTDIISSHKGVPVTLMKRGYYSPPMPKVDGNYNTGSTFDGYDKHLKTNLRVTVIRNGFESDYFNDPISDNPRCIERLGSLVAIKTWYSIVYSSEL